MRTTHAALSLVIVLIALVIRWPNLGLIPRFTDETAEVGWAIRIARGEILPLTHIDTYNGVVFPYLMAGFFRVFGPNPLLPRLTMTILGATLAGLVAWLAWHMNNQRLKTKDQRLKTEDWGHPQSSVLSPQSSVLSPQSSVLSLQSSIFNLQSSVFSLWSLIFSGLLTATSFPLIVLGSHVAWSNNLTPLLTTAALGATWWAITYRRPRWLVGAGCLWGLALQTHPSVVALAPGVVLWAVAHPQGRAWLGARWPWLAGVGFLLAYGNMLVFNLTQAGASVVEASNTRNAFGVVTSPQMYVENLAALIVQWARMMAGAYAPFDGQSAPFVMTPLVPVYGILGIAALVWSIRFYSILPSVALSFVLILPLVSRAFDALYDTRYIAPLLPITYLAMGLATFETLKVFKTFRVLPLILALVLIIAPVWAVRGFYAASEAGQLTNAPLLAMATVAKNEATQGRVVLLDRELRSLKLGGGGDPARALEYLLTLDGTDHLIARPDTINWYLVNSEAPLLLILSDATSAALATRYPLTPTGLTGPGITVYTAPRAR